MNATGMTNGRPWRVIGWGLATALILLPLAAMQLTDEMNWGIEDFAFAAALVLGVGGALELAMRTSASGAYRGGVAVALAAGILMLWINGAVGIIGSEDNPANWLFAGVLAVAAAGALAARFAARGMARAMVAAALAQIAVAVLVWFSGLGFIGPVTIFFAALWLIAAGLFRKAAGEAVGA